MFNEKWYPIRVAILLLIAVALWAVAMNASAQNARTKTFPIGKPFVASVAICGTEEYAKNVADDASVFDAYRTIGVCAQGEIEVTFLRRVYANEKTRYNVYEVEIEGNKLYSITYWAAEEI